MTTSRKHLVDSPRPVSERERERRNSYFLCVKVAELGHFGVFFALLPLHMHPGRSAGLATGQLSTKSHKCKYDRKLPCVPMCHKQTCETNITLANLWRKSLNGPAQQRRRRGRGPTAHTAIQPNSERPQRGGRASEVTSTLLYSQPASQARSKNRPTAVRLAGWLTG